jgi:hypothetical protein
LKTAMELYRKHQLVLVRPDLYVTWVLKASVTCISSIQLQKVAQIACAELSEESVEVKAASVASFLTQRFITNIQGFRVMHRHATYIENVDKASVIAELAKKNKEKVENVSLTTKHTVVGDAKALAAGQAGLRDESPPATMQAGLQASPGAATTAATTNTTATDTPSAPATPAPPLQDSSSSDVAAHVELVTLDAV